MTTIKVLALVVLAAGIFTVQAFSEADLSQSALYCLQKLGMENSIAVNNFDKDNLVTEGNALMNALFDCSFHKDGWVNVDGSVNFEVLAVVFEADFRVRYPAKDIPYLVTESINPCKNIRGNDKGDTYVKVYNCVLQKSAELAAQ